jgi:signal transduction histidine kinase
VGQGIQEFKGLTASDFAALLKRLGFLAGALYQLNPHSLIKVISAGDSQLATPFPVALRLSSDYTAKLLVRNGVPRAGWQDRSELGFSERLFPKGAFAYIPDHEVFEDKYLIIAIPETWWGVSLGDLYGPFEAVAARARSWQTHQRSRAELNERGIKEHLKRVQLDLGRLLDHELRTPLVSVIGHTEILRNSLGDSADPGIRDSLAVLVEEAKTATQAIERISLSLYGERSQEATATRFDALNALARLCSLMQERAGEFVGEDRAQQIKVSLFCQVAESVPVLGDISVFDWALWEVLKNAVQYTKSGKVIVNAQVDQGMLVIDVKDDGPGVYQGSEDLIFLRFFQDESNQKYRLGKKGLGIGLYLARHMVERHLGKLTFIRDGNTSIFRFYWPVAEESEIAKGA